MRFFLSPGALCLWAALVSSTHRIDASEQGLRRRLTAKNDCTIMAAEAIALEGTEEQDMELECEMDPADADGFSGITYRLDVTDAQGRDLRALINSGQVIPGLDKLRTAGLQTVHNTVFVPPGLAIAGLVRKNNSNGRRRLVATTGNLSMLLVKVTDIDGKAYPDSPTLMSDEVFGTGVDTVNLKSSLEECSWNQLTVIPGLNDPNQAAVGVVEVSIPISIQTNDRYAIRNNITAAVQTKLGHPLPGPYNYVQYSIEKCYVNAAEACGWAAFAYISSWNSMYQSGYYKQPGVLTHELGHNFGLAHSGGTDMQTYTDHSCAMGNPWYSDDNFECYNPAKNFQLNWYTPAKITEDPTLGSFTKTITLVGVGEYDKALNAGYPVTLRLLTGGSNPAYFVGFNRKIGPNRFTKEGADLVTVIQVSSGQGTGYAQSYLKAKLATGQSYTIDNYGGTGKAVTIVVDSINLTTAPGTATVTITDGAPTPPPTDRPTPNPTSPPTIPPPTSSPTPNPTSTPTIPSPTSLPTPTPTSPPTSVYKYICASSAPLETTICADGSIAGGKCATVGVESNCGNNRNPGTCYWASCSGGPPPAPSPGTCSITGTSCRNNSECCSGKCNSRKGTCQ